MSADKKYRGVADRVLDKLDELGQFERGDLSEADLSGLIEAVAEVIQRSLAPPEASIQWTPELEQARIGLCEFWVKISDETYHPQMSEIWQKAAETEQALTILGEIARCSSTSAS